MNRNSNRDSSRLMNLAWDWYNVIATKEKNGELNAPVSADDIFRFMTYWVAFNSLYSESKSFSSNEQNDSQFTERYSRSKPSTNDVCPFYDSRFPKAEKKQIFLYTDSIMNDLCKIGFNNLVKNCDEILQGPVYDTNSARSSPKNKNAKFYHENIEIGSNNSEPLKIMSLVMTIYQIRCNLFHGDKSPHKDRDLKLVSEGACILKRIMRVILHNNDKENTYFKIQDVIRTYNTQNCPSTSEWSGADLIITSKETENLIRFAKENPGVEIVITDQAQYIIWLINQMKPYAKIDYLSKYDYYHRIGQAANIYLKTHNEPIDTHELLYTILENVKEFFD